MRSQAIAVLAFFILLPVQVKGQGKDSSDKAWPSLGSPEKVIHVDQPRFIIEFRKLEQAPDESNPPWIPRCPTSSNGCIAITRATDFFSEWKNDMGSSILRPDVMMHHYPYVLFEGHYQGTGTYVFYLPGRNIFYLWGDCVMGHADLVAGPFAGDPRVALKKLAEDPEAVAQLGSLIVPFQAQGRGMDSSDKAWPALPRVVIDASKLIRAQNVFNPLSLDRCRTSSEECVVYMRDFTSQRRDQSGRQKEALRPDVIVHYYLGVRHQDAQRGVLNFDTYVFYLPERNMFYLGGYDSDPRVDLVLGPFAGDPRVALKKLAEAPNAK